MKIASKNTAAKHTLARGSAKMLRKLAQHGRPIERRRRARVATPRNAKNAMTATTSPNSPRMANTPRQPSRSPITPANDGAEHVAGEADREQPADRHLALA